MRLRNTILALFILAVAVTFGSVQAQALNELVSNGGFENGNTSGWTIVGGVFVTRFSHSGMFSLRLGYARHPGQISQSFNVPVGVSPTLSFSYRGDAGDDDLGVLIATLLDQNGAIIAQWNGVIDFRWHQITFQVDAKYAGSTLTLTFFGKPDLAHEFIDNYYCRPPPFPCRHRVVTYAVYSYVDDVSVSY